MVSVELPLDSEETELEAEPEPEPDDLFPADPELDPSAEPDSVLGASVDSADVLSLESLVVCLIFRGVWKTGSSDVTCYFRRTYTNLQPMPR